MLGLPTASLDWACSKCTSLLIYGSVVRMRQEWMHCPHTYSLMCEISLRQTLIKSVEISIFFILSTKMYGLYSWPCFLTHVDIEWEGSNYLANAVLKMFKIATLGRVSDISDWSHSASCSSLWEALSSPAMCLDVSHRPTLEEVILENQIVLQRWTLIEMFTPFLLSPRNPVLFNVVVSTWRLAWLWPQLSSQLYLWAIEAGVLVVLGLQPCAWTAALCMDRNSVHPVDVHC